MTYSSPERAQDWRQLHLGRLLGQAMRRFDDRVLFLMAHHEEVPLALANLAARNQVSAAHVHIPLERIGAKRGDEQTSHGRFD